MEVPRQVQKEQGEILPPERGLVDFVVLSTGLEKGQQRVQCRLHQIDPAVFYPPLHVALANEEAVSLYQKLDMRPVMYRMFKKL